MLFPLPDWRDESAYPSPETQQDLAFWAWQFLRRNRNYQAEWVAYVDGLAEMVRQAPQLEPYISAHCSVGPKSTVLDAWSASGSEPTMELLILLANREEFHCDDTPPDNNGHQWSRTKAFALGAKWGLQQIQHPGNYDLIGTNRFLADSRFTCTDWSERVPVDDKNYLVQQFDFRQSVGALTQQFQRILRERSRRIESAEVIPYGSRPDRAITSYRSYLRYLDAVEDGASAEEISKTLLPHQDVAGANRAVTNWKNAAVELRDSTYRVIPAYAAKPTR